MNANRLHLLPERFASRILVDPITGCWLWQGALNDSGYGRITIAGTTWRTHRYAYAHLVGPIPDGHVLDHLCRVRSCACPGHLDPVDPAVNTMRGIGPTALKAAQETCTSGRHGLAGDNGIIERQAGRRPARRCRACRDEWRTVQASLRQAVTP